jgi:hypothetical protein
MPDEVIEARVFAAAVQKRRRRLLVLAMFAIDAP